MINEKENLRQIKAQILDCATTKNYVKSNIFFHKKGGEVIADTSDP